ncbi:cation:proton antiporter [Limosilactobacillus sp.]|jgi:CPA1 family monovalent cation:H+ antiporter|uniref:cation:proton antiporter n=1 Tax=Limosilactobacillus sp. TaxID=2773925 RepID=UPI0025C537B9|nr:cation:proton antiporter [Limosilactobacillus sp.]MCH3921468.1 cation:proton antiporter [Limosilactobacillus sp.]MCH3928239.1 cation:proton antiporter [Limosilactobacillus sp.]
MLLSSITIVSAAVFASILAGFIPRLSINYVCMLFGVLIVVIAPLNHLVTRFDAGLFMYIVAPLIYFEGQTTRLNAVRQSIGKIIGTAIVLVVAAMAISGSLLTLWGVPAALAFLIAALSTPTDATATAAVSTGLIVPKRQNDLLKMESLFNDASGIILITACTLWIQNGAFQYQWTILHFFTAAIGGILIGIAAALVMITFRRGLQQLNSWAANAQNMLFIATPFVVYYLAEELHVSGIIAVVCAGLMQNSESASSRFIHPRQYHNGLVLMGMLQELLNNMVFVILGIIVSRVVYKDLVTQSYSGRWLLIGLALYIVNVIVRYLYGRLVTMTRRGSLIFALGGVRGAVTLALVYSVAASVSAHQFNQVILVETLVVLLSMIVPSLLFPFLLEHDISEKETARRIVSIKEKMVEEGIKAIEKIYLPPTIRANVLYDLRDQQSNNSFKKFWQHWLHTSRQPELSPGEKEMEQRALRWAFRAEREYLDMISQKENLRDYVYQLYNGVLLAESILIDPDNELR